jgi:hypothetical protein
MSFEAGSPEGIMRALGGTTETHRPQDKSSGNGESNAEDKADADPALWIDDGDWAEADIPCRPWVVPGYALRGSVTLVTGPPSAMKSSVMLAWAVAIALHREFGRFQPLAAGKVIIYNVEDDMHEQRRRLSAALRQFGAAPVDIQQKIIRVGPSTIGTLVQREAAGEISFTGTMTAIVELIKMHKPSVLIVDPLAELHTAEENDNTALRAVIAEFRKIAVLYNLAVVILHHTRKGSGQAAGDPESARGASSIIGAVRVAVTLTGMTEDDAKAFGMPTDPAARSHYVRMDDAKSNYAPLRSAQWFEKLAIELDNGDTVAAAVPWIPPQAKVATHTELAALASAIELGAPGGEPWSPKLSDEPRSVRALLKQFEFFGDAQKAVMARLQAECGVVTGRYHAPSRHWVAGLHVANKPQAKWQEMEEVNDAA